MRRNKHYFTFVFITIVLLLVSCNDNNGSKNHSTINTENIIDTLNASKTFQSLSQLSPEVRDTIYRNFFISLFDNKNGEIEKIKPHIPFYTKTIDDTTLAQSLSELYEGTYLFCLEKYDSAKIDLESAVKKLPYKAYWKEVTFAKSFLAVIYANDGEYDRSIKTSMQVLRNIEQNEGRNAWYFRENGMLSFTYSYALEYKKAIETIDKSIAFFQESNDLYNLAYYESSKSAILFANKQFQESYDLAMHSLTLREQLKDTLGIAESYNNIALYYSYKKDYAKSTYYLEKAKDIFYKTKSYTRLSTILMNIAFCLKQQNKLDEAIAVYNESFQIAKKLNQSSEMARCYNALSAVYLLKNDYKQAFDYLSKGKDLENKLLNIEKLKEIQKLSIKYEVQKKNQLLDHRQKELKLARYRFYWIFSIFLSISVILLFVINYFRAKNKREKIEADYRKEIIELEAKKTIKSLEIQILHAQMNPHFVFNCLCSIQNLFMKNDHLEANLKLSSFSKLLRMSIDHVRNNFVTVKSEINFIKLYIDLEQMQFDKPFDFEFINHCKTSLDELEMPSMIIQPYVENAINHGLKNKSGYMRLIIEVTENEDNFCIQINDNGVGREEAAKIKQLSSHKHVSKGLSLVSEKIQVLNEIYNICVDSEIMDNFNLENESTGTTVIITFPKFFEKHFKLN